MRTSKTIPARTSGAVTTHAQLFEDLSSACIVPSWLTGNLALRDILVAAKISNSKAYELGLVPMYDKNGIPIEKNTTPPFPWLRLPTPIVKTGKKLWNAEDVMNWHYRIRARALSMDSSTSSDDLMQCEVLHGN